MMRGYVGVDAVTKPDDAVRQTGGRKAKWGGGGSRAHAAQAGCGVPARSATSAAMSPMIRFSSKSLGV